MHVIDLTGLHKGFDTSTAIDRAMPEIILVLSQFDASRSGRPPNGGS